MNGEAGEESRIKLCTNIEKAANEVICKQKIF